MTAAAVGFEVGQVIFVHGSPTATTPHNCYPVRIQEIDPRPTYAWLKVTMHGERPWSVLSRHAHPDPCDACAALWTAHGWQQIGRSA